MNVEKTYYFKDWFPLEIWVKIFAPISEYLMLSKMWEKDFSCFVTGKLYPLMKKEIRPLATVSMILLFCERAWKEDDFLKQFPNMEKLISQWLEKVPLSLILQFDSESFFELFFLFEKNTKFEIDVCEVVSLAIEHKNLKMMLYFGKEKFPETNVFKDHNIIMKCISSKSMKMLKHMKISPQRSFYVLKALDQEDQEIFDYVLEASNAEEYLENNARKKWDNFLGTEILFNIHKIRNIPFFQHVLKQTQVSKIIRTYQKPILVLKILNQAAEIGNNHLFQYFITDEKYQDFWNQFRYDPYRQPRVFAQFVKKMDFETYMMAKNKINQVLFDGFFRKNFWKDFFDQYFNKCNFGLQINDGLVMVDMLKHYQALTNDDRETEKWEKFLLEHGKMLIFHICTRTKNFAKAMDILLDEIRPQISWPDNFLHLMIMNNNKDVVIYLRTCKYPIMWTNDILEIVANRNSEMFYFLTNKSLFDPIPPGNIEHLTIVVDQKLKEKEEERKNKKMKR